MQIQSVNKVIKVYLVFSNMFRGCCDGVAKLPRPSSSAQRASRPAPDFMIYFIKNETIIAALVGNGFLNK